MSFVLIQGYKEWEPEYERWRHGGWYVTNCTYPSGAIGCVSNNYPDKKWRIVSGTEDVTFPSRDAAAKAEYFAIQMLSKYADRLKGERDGIMG